VQQEIMEDHDHIDGVGSRGRRRHRLIVTGAMLNAGPGDTTGIVGDRVDWCPGNASICTVRLRLATLSANTTVMMNCWVDSRANGFDTPRWFYVTTGGFQGFVKAGIRLASRGRGTGRRHTRRRAARRRRRR
jgi:hypothetical protein